MQKTPSIPRESNTNALLDGYVASASVTTNPICLNYAKGMSLSFSCPSTGSPVGTLKIQVTNDKEDFEGKADEKLVNWVDRPFVDLSSGNVVSSTAVSGATTIVIEDADIMWRWMRVVYTQSSGSCTMTLRVSCMKLG